MQLKESELDSMPDLGSRLQHIEALILDTAQVFQYPLTNEQTCTACEKLGKYSKIRRNILDEAPSEILEWKLEVFANTYGHRETLRAYAESCGKDMNVSTVSDLIEFQGSSNREKKQGRGYLSRGFLKCRRFGLRKKARMYFQLKALGLVHALRKADEYSKFGKWNCDLMYSFEETHRERLRKGATLQRTMRY